MSAAHLRIVKVHLDEQGVVYRSRDVEHERAVAIYDLLEENHFAPAGHAGGPYHLILAIEESRLVLDVRTTEDAPVERIALSLGSLRRVIKDYFIVCENYYQAIRTLSPSQIEAIDMGRRSLHNEGSEILKERLAERFAIDFNTARRLFTLVCVLHVRG
ncbi:MAG: UPF0262 family protein [Alphaproteobacteria bacterium]|nr:UPF0262 family protein [Alphaproteobacteria bacterium]